MGSDSGSTALEDVLASPYMQILAFLCGFKYFFENLSKWESQSHPIRPWGWATCPSSHALPTPDLGPSSPCLSTFPCRLPGLTLSPACLSQLPPPTQAAPPPSGWTHLCGPWASLDCCSAQTWVAEVLRISGIQNLGPQSYPWISLRRKALCPLNSRRQLGDTS